jgi:hypothetical protein
MLIGTTCKIGAEWWTAFVTSAEIKMDRKADAADTTDQCHAAKQAWLAASTFLLLCRCTLRLSLELLTLSALKSFTPARCFL